MIEIKEEIVKSMFEESGQDVVYFFEILNRIDTEIKTTMLQLLWKPLSFVGAVGAFYFALSNGLDKFEAPIVDPKGNFDFGDRVCQFAGYFEHCEKGHGDRLLAMVTLYRFFEMELEERCENSPEA